MAYHNCNKCEETIHPNRYKLGYRTCLACGDEVAQRLAEVPRHLSAAAHAKVPEVLHAGPTHRYPRCGDASVCTQRIPPVVIVVAPLVVCPTRLRLRPARAVPRLPLLLLTPPNPRP